MDDALIDLGWNDGFQQSYVGAVARGLMGPPGRVSRLDRGWSSLLPGGPDGQPRRTRNIGADVAVGDWVVTSADGERVECILDRSSALVRRASFAGARGESHTLAANVDVVGLLHALTSPPNPRRLERELVLAFDSGARPVVVLTKADATEHPEAVAAEVARVALDVPVLTVSSRTGAGVDAVRSLVAGHRTLVLLGASGVGKSTLVNRIVGTEIQRTGAVREGDDRGRHTTVAAELVAVPGGGWLIDTPGLRAVSLWSSGRGIERAFADVFDLMDRCRFRNCKHDLEPGCAVRAAIDAGTLGPDRLTSLQRLVAEEAAIEVEQEERVRDADRRPGRRPPPTRTDDSVD
jgi:ribosome biogenesis GTPase